MRQREFLGVLSGAAAMPLAARAQQSGKPPVIGFMGASTPAAWGSRELGWGRTARIEYRWAENRSERFPEIAAEFVRLKVDVIFTAGSTSVLAAKKATSVIPIVFALASNPVDSGLVASLSRPGGNVTGLSIQGTDAAGKRIELMREVVPGLRRWAIMANMDFPDAVARIGRGAVDRQKRLAWNLTVLEIRRADDIARAFEHPQVSR